VAAVSDLDALLAGLDASSDRTPYLFCSVPSSSWPPAVPEGVEPVAVVAEDEGFTLVVAAEQADAAGLDADRGFVAGRVTLRVHSDLAAVGLTAHVSRMLADAGISANVVAGRFHDHVFVPFDRLDEALDLLGRAGS
jgi:uncharacterized protein